MELTEEIAGKLYSVRPSTRQDVCPICGKQRKEPKENRAEGFAAAGFSRHIFACYEKALANIGYREGVYDDDLQRFPVVPL